MPAAPQRRPSSPLHASHRLTQFSRNPESSDLVPTPNGICYNPSNRDTSVPPSIGLHNGSVAETTSTDASVPAAKRRRVEKTPGPSQRDESRAPIASANVPIPSTETNETVLESASNAEAPILSKIFATAKKPKVSAQEKRKQHIADAAAKVVADATRPSSARAKKSRQSASGKGIQRDESTTVRAPSEATQEPSSQAEENAVLPKAKRKYTRRKTLQSIEDAAAEVVEDAVQGSSKDPIMRGRRRKRAPTPEGAETLQITPSEIR